MKENVSGCFLLNTVYKLKMRERSPEGIRVDERICKRDEF